MKSSAVPLSSSLADLSGLPFTPGSLCSIAHAVSINRNGFNGRKILRAYGTPERIENCNYYQYSIPTGFSESILLSSRDNMSVD